MDKIILPLFKAIAGDDQDSVRLLAIQAASDLGENLSLEQLNEHIMPVILLLSRDTSWRVRFMVAAHLVKIALPFNSDSNRVELLDIFVNLLRDSEPEVRAAAALIIADFGKLLKESQIIHSICPPALVLVNDTSQHVRGECSLTHTLSPMY